MVRQLGAPPPVSHVEHGDINDGTWTQSAKKASISHKPFLRLKNDPQKMNDLRKKRQEEKKSSRIKK